MHPTPWKRDGTCVPGAKKRIRMCVKQTESPVLAMMTGHIPGGWLRVSGRALRQQAVRRQGAWDPA